MKELGLGVKNVRNRRAGEEQFIVANPESKANRKVRKD